MPRDKSATHARVVNAAMEEFLEKGYSKTSMKDIGDRAGLTPAGLYRHYKSKEDMFNALVEPAVISIKEWYRQHKLSSYYQIDEGADKTELFSNTMVDFARDVIYKHSDEFQLIFMCSEGTKYADFIHEIIKVEQRDMMEALEYMRSKGMKVKMVSEEEMHMLISAYTTALFEPFMHNMSKEKTERCLETIEEFFMPGWQKIMGY